MKLFARITPLLDVSEQCEKESVFYLQNLIGNPEHPLWAIKSRFQNIKNSLEYSILLILLIFGLYGSNSLNTIIQCLIPLENWRMGCSKIRNRYVDRFHVTSFLRYWEYETFLRGKN